MTRPGLRKLFGRYGRGDLGLDIRSGSSLGVNIQVSFVLVTATMFTFEVVGSFTNLAIVISISAA
jgi:hypothetical protein